MPFGSHGVIQNKKTMRTWKSRMQDHGKCMKVKPTGQSGKSILKPQRTKGETIHEDSLSKIWEEAVPVSSDAGLKQFRESLWIT